MMYSTERIFPILGGHSGCLVLVLISCLSTMLGPSCYGQFFPPTPPTNQQQPISRFQQSAPVQPNNPLQLVGQAQIVPAPTHANEFQGGELVAIVGNQHILAGDMKVFIQTYLDANRGKITPEQEMELIRQVLVKYVEIKATYIEFFHDMAGNKPPKEVADMEKKIRTKAAQMFYEKQVPRLMNQNKVNDEVALELKLREKSSSLQTMRSQFIEQVLSNELVRKYVPDEFDFSREELLNRYNADAEKWNVPARARWRELCIRFSKHDRAEAEQMINSMGREVYFGGKPFEAVAKDSSEGFTAGEGGAYDWTNQGSLKSKALDAAIFTYELRKLSPVIEDEIGFHIIEVLERELAHTKSFPDAQPEIKKQLSEEKRSKLTDDFFKKVMAKTPIWTRWPEDISGSRPLSDVIGR
jgi:PPIC-type PPIASE domain